MTGMIGMKDKATGDFNVTWKDGAKSTYELVGEEPYVRKDGTSTTLVVWRSLCVTCGAEFVTKTPGQLGKDKLSFGRRACDQHKAARWFGVTKNHNAVVEA